MSQTVSAPQTLALAPYTTWASNDQVGHTDLNNNFDRVRQRLGRGIGSAVRWIEDVLGEIIYLNDYILPEDNGNVSYALQRAHDYLKLVGGGRIRTPSGQLKLDPMTDGNGNKTGLVVEVGFSIEGPGTYDAYSDQLGTCFVISDPSFSPISMTALEARGFAIRGCAIKQVHAPFAAGWTPTAYPDVVSINGCGGLILMEDVCLLGVNSFMSCVSSGRLFWDRVWGQVYTRGLFIDDCLDCPHFRNIHFWPFVSEGVVGRDTTHAAVGYQQQNCDMIVFGRCDNPFVDNVLGFGMRSVFHCTQTASGTLTSSQVGAFTADACKWPIWVDSTVTQGAFFTAADVYLACETLAGPPIPNGSCILLEGSANVQIAQYRFYFCAQSPVRCTNATLASVVNLGQGSMVQCAKDGTTDAPVPYVFLNQCGPGPHQLQLNSRPQTDLVSMATQLCNWDTSNFIFINCTGAEFDYQIVAHIATNDMLQFFNNRHTLFWGGGDGSTVSGIALYMPPNPIDGEFRKVVFLNPVSSVTFGGGYPVGPTYPPVIGAPSSATAHNEIVFQYLVTSADGTGAHWRCRSQG